MKDLKKTVGKICGNCMFSCFKEKCSRKDWCKESYPSDKYGVDDKCPLESFEAEQTSSTAPLSLRGLTIVCHNCPHYKENMSMDEFILHCMDCSCNQLKESISEAFNESFVS